VIKGANLMKCGPFSTDLQDFGGAHRDDLLKVALNNIENYNSNEKIDPVTNLANVATYLLGGSSDKLIHEEVYMATKGVYDHYHTEKLRFDEKDETHGTTQTDFIEGLEYIYTQLGYAPSYGFELASEDPLSLGTLKEFEMLEFLPTELNWENSTFRDYGYIYVPTACEND